MILFLTNFYEDSRFFGCSHGPVAVFVHPQDGVELSIRGRARPLRARATILTGPPPAILKIDFQPPLASW